MERTRRKHAAPPVTDWGGTRPRSQAKPDPDQLERIREAQEVSARERAERAASVGGFAPTDAEGSGLYPSDAPERAYRLALLGLTNKEIGVAFGIAVETVDDWMAAYPDFRAAIYAGRELADAEVVRALFQKAVGYEHDEMITATYQGDFIDKVVTKKYAPDTAACIYWLNNRRRRQKEPWTNSQKMELTGAGGGPILLAPAEAEAAGRLTDDELEALASAGIKLQGVDPKLLGE